jgi:transporter family protein
MSPFRLPIEPWAAWALFSAIFAALTAIFAKIGLQGVDSDFATLVRTAIILILLAVFVRLTGKWVDPARLSPSNWTFLALSALATGASWVCYFRALQVGEASRVAPIDKLSVVLVAILAVVFLGERPAAKDWAGIGLVAAGVVLLAWRR